jgi:hypothetical protein
MDGLPDHQVVQDLVDAGHAASQVANVLVGIALQHTLEANAIGNSANHERGESKPRLRTKAAVDGLLKPVRRVSVPMQIRFYGRARKGARRADLNGATVSHPRFLSVRCRAVTLSVIREVPQQHEFKPFASASRAFGSSKSPRCSKYLVGRRVLVSSLIRHRLGRAQRPFWLARASPPTPKSLTADTFLPPVIDQ